MATTTFTCNKDARVADFSGLSEGAGASDFNPIGVWGSFQFRTLLGFSYSFSGMVSITSAILHMRTSTQYYVAFGSDPDIRVQRLSASWTEGTDSVLQSAPSPAGAVEWSNQPGVTGSTATLDVSTSESTWVTVDITTMMEEARAAGTFYGLRLISWTGAAESGSTSDTTEIYSREQGSSDPYISITYTDNVVPSAPISCLPKSSTLTTPTPTLTFTHSDVDGDALLDYDIQVANNASFTSPTWNIAAQTSGITANNVSRVYAGTALTRGGTYYWRARTSSATGAAAEGAWSAANAFVINALPTFTYVVPSAENALLEMTKVAGSGTNPRMTIRWTFADSNAGHAQTAYQVLVKTDADVLFHDTGKVTSTASSVLIPVDAVRAITYRVTITVWDTLNEANTAVTFRRGKAQWSVTDYKFDTGSTPTAWSTAVVSTKPTNTNIVLEYSSTAAGTAPGTWYSTLGSAGLLRWFHFKVWLFAWSGAATPTMTSMKLTYTNATAVLPDGWTVGTGWSIDKSVRVYGTQSIAHLGNGSASNAYQLVNVEPDTDYIISGRIKSDGDSGARILISSGPTSGGIVNTAIASATQDFTLTKSNVWNSGSNNTIYVRCFAQGSAGANAWFDAIKMEASTVATPWTPGFIGPAITLDAGGLQIDASNSGVMRLLGSTGGTRDTIELHTKGLLIGPETQLYSDIADYLTIDSPGTSTGLRLSTSGTTRGIIRASTANNVVISPISTGGTFVNWDAGSGGFNIGGGGGVAVASVASNGQIDNPAVGHQITKTGTQSINGSAWTKITSFTVTTKTGFGTSYNAYSDSGIRANEAGLFVVSYGARLDSAPTGTRFLVGLWQANAASPTAALYTWTQTETNNNTGATNTIFLNSSVLLNLAVNDVVCLVVYHDNGTALNSSMHVLGVARVGM